MKRFILVHFIFLLTINFAESRKIVDHPSVSEAVKLLEIWLEAQRDYEGYQDYQLLWSMIRKSSGAVALVMQILTKGLRQHLKLYTAYAPSQNFLPVLPLCSLGIKENCVLMILFQSI